ncbi:MAG: hypothetical protein RIC14_08840 [Filomicrobium sp.]
MGVSPGIDLIAGVLRNAPGNDIENNFSSLTSASRAAPIAAPSQAGSFGDVVRSALDATATLEAKTAVADNTKSGLVQVRPEKKEDAEEMLQRLLLNTVVETILPKEMASFTGGGTAGNVWRSMLAEHVAAELSQSLDLNLFDGRTLDGQSRPVQSVASTTEGLGAVPERKREV